MRPFQRFLMTSAAITAVGTVGGVASAAEDQPADQPNDSLQLEQVTVTATKRVERLQDVPVAVTAITADNLERNNVRELSDLVKLSPSLQITYGSQPGNFVISMRGIGTFSSGIAVESDVAVVIDDVPLSIQAQAFMDLIDVDRVEVLRGPQSTLFGKSAIAGVLNITTAAPTAEFSAKAMAYYTDDNEKRAGLTFSGPLSDTLRYRLTISDSDYDGNLTNIYNGQKINGSSGLTATGKLEWLPTDNFTLTLMPRFNRNESTCCSSAITSLPPGLYYQGATQLPESLVLKGITVGPTNRNVDMDQRNGGGDSRLYGGTVKAEYNFSDSFMKGYSLASISSYQHWRMFDYQDQDGTAVPFLLYYPLTKPSGIDSGAYQSGFFHATGTTEEIRLTSPSDSRFRYIAGLWYAKNVLNRYLYKRPVFNYVAYMGSHDNTNYSAFFNATYDVTDKFSLIGGYRRNLEKISYIYDNYTALPNPLHFSDANEDASNTGKAGVEYHWTPDIMTYGTFSTGYKGQAYDLVSTLNKKEADTFPVKHELAHSYEVGIKSSLFDRRMYLNFDLFTANYTGFQTSVTSSLPDGTFLTALNSVGRLRTRGAELDSQVRATENLTLSGSYAYTKATIVEFPNGPCYGGQPAGTGPGQCFPYDGGKAQNLAGGRLNNVPLNKFNVGGEYDHGLGSLPFAGFFTFQYRWQSAVNFSLSQDPRTIQGSYGIANFGAGINDNSDHYKVTLFVNNAFDKHYATGLADSTSGFSAAGVTGVFGSTWTPARDAFLYYGIRVDVKF